MSGERPASGTVSGLGSSCRSGSYKKPGIGSGATVKPASVKVARKSRNVPAPSQLLKRSVSPNSRISSWAARAMTTGTADAATIARSRSAILVRTSAASASPAPGASLAPSAVGEAASSPRTPIRERSSCAYWSSGRRAKSAWVSARCE